VSSWSCRALFWACRAQTVSVSCWTCASSAAKSTAGSGAGFGAAGAGTGGAQGGILVMSGRGVVSVQHHMGVDCGNSRRVGGESDESPKRANCSGGGMGVQAQEAEKRERERGSS
jgi:hypothetical protein